MRLSIVIPAHNEEHVLEPTLAALQRSSIPRASTMRSRRGRWLGDGTAAIVERLADADPRIRSIRNEGAHGFGYAVRAGLAAFTGDAVVIVMADGSDDPRDIILYYRVLEAGYDCAFGSRFMPGAVVTRLPASEAA